MGSFIVVFLVKGVIIEEKIIFLKEISQLRDLNPQPTDYKSVTLPVELSWQKGV